MVNNKEIKKEIVKQYGIYCSNRYINEMKEVAGIKKKKPSSKFDGRKNNFIDKGESNFITDAINKCKD